MSISVPSDVTIINASNHILGRLASIVAKRLLAGEKIIIVNAEKTVLTGRKLSRLKEFTAYLEIVGRSNPKYGPHHPRSPDAILRHTVRGMLPRDKAKGRKAYRYLKVYTGLPSNIDNTKIQEVPNAQISESIYRYVYLGKISEEIGWKKEVRI